MFNAENYIDETIRSVLSQRGLEYELIIVDDGSTDKSSSICEKYDDERVRLLSQENAGAPAARNRGLKHACGDYVLFLDADDTLCPHLFEQLYEVIHHASYQCVIGSFLREVEGICTLDTCKQMNNDRIYDYYFIPPYPCNKLFSTEILLTNQVWFDETKIAQDLNFFFKFLGVADSAHIITINTCFCKYRLVRGSISHSNDSRINDIVKTVNGCIQYYKSIVCEETRFDYMLISSLRHICYQIEKTPRFKDAAEGTRTYSYLKAYWRSIRRQINSRANAHYLRYLLRADALYLYTIIKTKIFYMKTVQ